jgi:uracil-DNA glycosylase
MAKAKKEKKFNVNKMPQVAEGWSKASPKRQACNACGRYVHCSDRFQFPTISDDWNGRLLLISDPLGSTALKVARKAWEAAGYSSQDVAVLSPIRCESKKKPSMTQIRACRPFLLKALRVLAPRNVLGLGAVALRALTNKADANLTKARGKKIKI